MYILQLETRNSPLPYRLCVGKIYLQLENKFLDTSPLAPLCCQLAKDSVVQELVLGEQFLNNLQHLVYWNICEQTDHVEAD